MTALNCILLPLLLIGGAVPAPLVPGEILIRFAAGSAGAVAAGEALRSSPPDLGRLGPAVEALHAQTGIPLQAVRCAGGNDVLVRVDAARLSEQTAARLRAAANVARVELQPDPAPGRVLGGVRTPGFLAAFEAGSPQAGCISKTGGEAFDQERCNPTPELSEQVGVPLKGRVHDDGRLLIEIDMAALTRVLVERLKTLPDIESAQPNFIMGIRPSL